jgi:RNAse (barnase) inhibitor barstar
MSSRFLFVDDLPPEEFESALVVQIPPWIVNKIELLQILAEGLNFPDYFGWNWDALDECLRDLSWIKSPYDIVLWHRGIPFMPGSDERATYLDILKVTVESWQLEREHRLTIVFPVSAEGEVSDEQ